MQRQQRSALFLLAVVCLGAGAQVASAAGSAAASSAEAAKASAASLIPNMAQMQQAAEAANNFIATVKTLKNTVDKVPALGNYLNRTLEQIPGIDKLGVLGDGVQLSDLSAINLPTSLEDLKSLKLPAFDFKAVEGGKVALNLTGIADKFGVDLGALTEQFKDSKLGEIASVPAEKFNKLPKGVRQALVWVTVANVVGAAGIKSVGGAKAAAAKMGISGGAVLSLLAGKGAGGAGGAAAEAPVAPEAAAAAADPASLPKLSTPKFDLKAIAGKFGLKVDGADAAAAAPLAAEGPLGNVGGPSAFDAPAVGAMVPESGRAGGFISAAAVHAQPELCGCPALVAPVCTGRNMDFDNECLARCTGARVILPGTCADQVIMAVSNNNDGDGGGGDLSSDLGSGLGPGLSGAGGLETAAGTAGGSSGVLGLSRGARSLLDAKDGQKEGAGAAAPPSRRRRRRRLSGLPFQRRPLSPRALSALRLAATAARAAGGQYGAGLSPAGEAEAAPPKHASMRVSMRAGAAGEAGADGASVGGGGDAGAWRPEVEQSLVVDGRETLERTSYVSEASTVDAKAKPAPPSVVDGLKAQVKARTGRR